MAHKRLSRVVVAVSLLLLTVAPLCAQQPYDYESIRLPSGSLREFIRASRKRLKQTNRPHFLHVMLYGPKGGHPLPIPASHFDYNHWLSLHQSAAATPNTIGELVAIGPNAVLRVRDQSQVLSRIVLEGRDPLLPDVHGRSADIIYIAYSGRGPFQLHRAIVFARSTPVLPPSDARELFQSLEPLFPNHELALYIRPDPWFIFTPHYPFANPFVELSSPSDEATYNQTPTIHCARQSGQLICR